MYILYRNRPTFTLTQHSGSGEPKSAPFHSLSPVSHCRSDTCGARDWEEVWDPLPFAANMLRRSLLLRLRRNDNERAAARHDNGNAADDDIR